MENNELRVSDNRTFDFVFTYETSTLGFWEKWSGSKEELVSLKTKMEETFGITFPQLFDNYYNDWTSILTTATDDLHSYIKMDVDHALREISPQNDFEKKTIVLSSKWVIIKINEFILKEPDLYTINLGITNLIVSPKAFFHVVWGHYYRLQEVSLRERNKSLFDHSSFEFLTDLTNICPALYHFENFGLQRKSFFIDYKSKVYTIVFEKKDVNYELVTFYLVDRLLKIEELKLKEKIKLTDDLFVFKE